MKDFVIPELPAYRPFYPLTHNSASGQKTARSVPVALKPRLMHRHHDLFASTRFPADFKGPLEMEDQKKSPDDQVPISGVKTPLPRHAQPLLLLFRSIPPTEGGGNR